MRTAVTHSPGQCHDGFSGHGDIAAPAQMRHQARPTAGHGRFGSGNDPNRRAVEFDLGVWHETRLLTDFDRVGHLTFGRNTHRPCLTLTNKSKNYPSET
jgi:hypothetical protein